MCRIIFKKSGWNIFRDLIIFVYGPVWLQDVFCIIQFENKFLVSSRYYSIIVFKYKVIKLFT